MGKVNKRLQDLDPKGSPHLEEKWIGGDCRSRSPLPNPSRRCKNHWRDGEESSSNGSAMGGKNELEEVRNIGEEDPLK